MKTLGRGGRSPFNCAVDQNCVPSIVSFRNGEQEGLKDLTIPFIGAKIEKA